MKFAIDWGLRFTDEVRILRSKDSELGLREGPQWSTSTGCSRNAIKRERAVKKESDPRESRLEVDVSSGTMVDRKELREDNFSAE